MFREVDTDRAKGDETPSVNESKAGVDSKSQMKLKRLILSPMWAKTLREGDLVLIAQGTPRVFALRPDAVVSRTKPFFARYGILRRDSLKRLTERACRVSFASGQEGIGFRASWLFTPDDFYDIRVPSTTD